MLLYRGALHIHTHHSDGTGSIPEVATAAREAGLRWIIITDHDTLEGRPWAGWHDGLLVIVDHEITPDRNHFLALNTNHVVDCWQPPQDFIDEVYRSGGFGIIAHPDERVQSRLKGNYRWEDWTVDGPRERSGRVVGLELWNAMSDWGEHVNLRNVLLYLLVPRLGLSGPTPATLNWWDKLNMAGRRTFGVGGVDVHAFKRRVPWGTIEIFPYRWMFGTLTTYLLLETPLDDDAQRATHQVYAALAAGRSYFLNRLDGDAANIPFMAVRGGEQWHMGDSPSLRDGPITLCADVGCDAYVRLIRNGTVVTSAIQSLRQSIDLPGVYRLEAYRGGRPWLYTNPLYVGGAVTIAERGEAAGLPT